MSMLFQPCCSNQKNALGGCSCEILAVNFSASHLFNDACVLRMPQILDLRDVKGPNVLYNTMQFVPTGMIQAFECWLAKRQGHFLALAYPMCWMNSLIQFWVM